MRGGGCAHLGAAHSSRSARERWEDPLVRAIGGLLMRVRRARCAHCARPKSAHFTYEDEGVRAICAHRREVRASRREFSSVRAMLGGSLGRAKRVACAHVEAQCGRVCVDEGERAECALCAHIGASLCLRARVCGQGLNHARVTRYEIMMVHDARDYGCCAHSWSARRRRSARAAWGLARPREHARA